jgi:uncharacterized protein (TIGR03435 family)
MTNRISYKLTLAKQLLLATAGMAAVAGPVLVGILDAPRSRAQTRPQIAVQAAPVGAQGPEEAVQAAQTAAPSPAARPVFDVASIRPSDPDEVGGRVYFPPGRFEVRNAKLIFVIQQVYGVKDYQIVEAPKWITDWSTARFNISAKAEGAASEEQLRLMAKNLLADRFKLKLHNETRELPVYVLVQDKKGIKLGAVPDNGRPMGSGYVESVDLGWRRGKDVSMEDLVSALSGQTDRPILDRTNYTEKFTFELKWAARAQSSGTGGLLSDLQPETGQASLFTTIREQMGLRLDPQKAPIEVLVIDHVERPSAN